MIAPEHQSTRAPQLAQLELALQTLNCLPVYAKVVQGQLMPSDIEPTLRDAKLALLRTAWDETQWGGYSEFVSWSRTGSPRVPEKIQILYDAQIDC